MLNNAEYIRLSLENNLFWTRIMKEHAIFIESSMPPIQKHLANQADQFKKQFERLLSDTIKLSNGLISARAMQSGQFFTRYTEAAEQATQKLTGIDINSNLTRMEYNIEPAGPYSGQQKAQEVSALNQNILNQVKAFAKFKTDLYDSQASCNIFTFLYTSVYEHIFHEAQRYIEVLTGLQERNENYNRGFKEFWNHHMSDHAKVMRGLFDPTEAQHFNTADRLAKLFEADSAALGRTEELDATIAISNFKASTTQEILECKVKSLMSPLFTDHILREAYHYIYLLKS